MESARRDAWFDVTEAKAKLARRKMECGAAQAGESAGDSGLKMEVELETIYACRRLGEIFDNVAHAAEERDQQGGTSLPADQRMAEMEEKAAALDARIAELSARNVPVLYGKIRRLENNLRCLSEVMISGQWKKVTADREILLEQALRLLECKGQYTGERTEAAAWARMEEIDGELKTLYEIKNKALTDEEEKEFAMKQRERAKITAAMTMDRPDFEKNAATGRAALEKFEARFEAALIDAASVVDVYRIDCERLALGFPNGV